MACHQGINVGGNMLELFGLRLDLSLGAHPGLAVDPGRYAVTHDEFDRHVFRVPSLRNVAVTSPYFHDGSVPTLEEAVDVMFTHQLGRTVSKNDGALIVEFLGTLTGEYRGHMLTRTPGDSGN